MEEKKYITKILYSTSKYASFGHVYHFLATLKIDKNIRKDLYYYSREGRKIVILGLELEELSGDGECLISSTHSNSTS